MVNTATEQLIENIHQIFNTFRETDYREIFDIYKNNLFEQGLCLAKKYANILERNPSIKNLFSCFGYLNNNKFHNHVSKFKVKIGLIKTHLLSFMHERERNHITYINDITVKINILADEYAEETNKFHWLNLTFKSKMFELSHHPKRFWELFNSNFSKRDIPEGLTIENLTEYNLVHHYINGDMVIPHEFDYSTYWIMQNSQGNTIVVCASLSDFKYYCINFVCDG